MRLGGSAVPLVFAVRSLVAQCPDGSPPPCARGGLASPDPGSGLGEVILARYWEAAGNPTRALALLRSRLLDLPDWSLPASYRTEGRLAALLGDTTGALRSYREYLDMRRFADSLLLPQRDSVRAELARLSVPRPGP